MGSVTKAESLAVTKIDSQTSEEISDCRDKNKHKVQGLHLLQRQGFFVSRNLLNSIMTTDQRTQNLNGDILQKSVNRFIEGYEKPRVKINNKGFSVNNITVMEGQIVNIEWENNSARLNLIQLIHDGDKLRPVIGGYSRDMPQSGKCEQQFNLEGEYKFAIGSVRCTPLTVNVRPRMDLQAEVTDEGFKPSVIVIDKGHSLKWHWKQCNALHSVHELAFCMRHGGFLLKSPSSGSVIGTVSGAYRHEFHQPGLYYFRTGSSDLGKTHLCIVCVRDILREHKIEVLDKAFQPMILLVTVGDKVWWHWDKFKCKRLHSVYQIEAPTINHPSNQPFEVKKDGFIWPSPSKQGLMSHEFHEPGVYLYSDRNSQECADYIGTIIVKPKRQEHMVEVTQKGFMTDLLHASTGDRIWWTWNAENLDSQKLFSICELEKSLTTTSSDVMCNDNCEPPEHEAAMLMKNLGLATACMTTTGVHYYSISSGVEKGNICSVIVNPSIKNHTIHVTDNGFEPKVITIQPNDQVWWIWQSGNKQHNVMQVSHECHLVTDGFCSGAITDCPSAFMHQFSDASGVFYFMNASLPNIFGAITVSSQPKVHEVQVTIAEVKPDPVMVHVNDVVCWIFKGPRQNDMCEVESIEALTTSNISGSLVPARICMARRIDRTGLFHFSSKSLQRRKTGSKGEIRLSSVIADEMSDYDAIIKVDSNGFHPSSLTIRKNQSVLWTWKGSDGSEGHNIIHVNSPDSNHPLSLVTGVQSFNSGKPIVEGTFQHTFYEMGNFSVVSQGAPGFSCSIHVLRDALRTDTPIISSKMDGGIIDVHSKVTLACNTAGAKIYFTVNSSMPQQHCGSTKLYDPKKGIILKNPGLCFLRAMASCEGRLSSQLFTSRRFWVVAEENDDDKQSVISTTEEIIPEKADSTEAWEWWKCVPEIKTLCISPGVIEVVWELPNKEPANLVKGYQVFLNGISYSAMFPPFTSSVQITGLAGGQEYDTYVQVYAKSNKFSPQQSNKVMILCPITSPEGGPLISLERTEQPDSLAVVWMAIKDIPIAGYWLYLNGQKCGKKVVPNAKSNRCKVVIEGCKLEKLFRFYVVAVPLEEGTEPKISNIMEVTLPLDSSDICLPPPEERFDEEDIYKEYLEVTEGSGYLPDTTEIVSADVHNEDIQRAPYTKDAAIIADDNKLHSTKEKNEDLLTDSHGSCNLAKIKTINLIKATPGKDESNESDTRTDSSLINSPLPSHSSVVVIDATKAYSENRTRVHSAKTYQSEILKENSFQGMVADIADLDLDRSKLKSSCVNKIKIDAIKKSSKRKSRTAIIELKNVADINATQHMEEPVSAEERFISADERTIGSITETNMKPFHVQDSEFFVTDGDGFLPSPSIMVEGLGINDVVVNWELQQPADPKYKVMFFVVSIIGTQFLSDINSNISFECNMMNEKNQQVRGVQHCWNVSNKSHRSCKIHGLIAGHTYRIHLVANYVQCHGDYPCEIQTSSALIHYTTKGPPKPPVINPLKVDLFQVSLELKPATQIHKDVQIKGYMIYIDGACIGGLHSRNIQQVVINNLIPGRTVHVSVVTIAKQAVGESIHSQPIHITCPHRPPAPQISQQPSYKKGCVLVAWERPPNITVTTNDEDISLYSIYLDDKWQGEIQANHYCDKHGYQFFLNDLTPGQNFDVYVKTVCGPKNVDPNAHHIYCLSESVPSIVVSVTVPAPPNSPKLRLEGLSPSGLDITWQTPQQYGDAAVSGYQMLKNGKLYGSVIPPEVNMLRIKDITLGEKVTLQLIALTEHPVGKTPALTNNDRDSGIEGSNPYEEKKNLLNDRYAGCKPGARLVVHFTGLVQPPSKVWCEKVTGHSALIVWSKDDHPKSHFVKPENYQVTWWPGNRAEEDIGSDSTSDDHLLLNNLQPSVTYTVVVEARKLQKYKNLDEDEMITDELDGMNAFILTSRSEQIKVMTASPPEPPSNLGMIATTCNSLRLAWHPPREHGVEVLGLRVECISLNNDNKHESQVLNLMPDTTEAIVGNLAEKTEHLIRVIAITDEYFEKLMHQHKMKQTRIIPPNVLVGSEQSKWLPNSSLIIKTSGTDPPTNLQVMKSTSTSLLLSWSSPVVYGSNKLMGAIVRWADTKTVQKSDDDDTIIARHISLPPHEDSFTIENLCPGSQYRIVVEAVVSLKTSLEPDRQDFGIEKDRRTVHIPSVPLFTRTRAPITLSPILVRSYRNDSVSLYWEKPLLTSVIGKDEMGKPLYLRRHLVGYKLEVNGVLQCTLKSQAKNCILTKCKPGKTYSIVLVALTCTDNMRKERKRMQKDAFTVSSSSDLDPSHLAGQGGGLDYSLSDPVEVCLPRKQEGSLVSLCTTYNQSEKNEGSTFGDIFVEWSTSLEKASTMKQFSVIWFCLDEKTVQTKYVGPDIHQCHLPVTRLKSVYEISVEPNFYGDIVAQTPQPVQVMIPGPPDAPEIFLKSVSGEEIIVEWGEPRMYSGVNIKGYQVYVNDKKVGTVLKSSHKRCVIPRHPNKQYKINLVTLGGNVIYGDSARSNSLVVDMAHGFVTKIGSVAQTEDNYLIPLKVVLVTDISIHLDWTSYLESEDIESFRIQWSSVAQPAQREVNLSPKDVNYVINKCLPRTTHFVRLIAFGQNGQIIDRSRQLTVQTSAPPDSPILSVRACNFHYITLQWEKPQTYGEALITGYKVYLDGVVETSLSADHHCFTFTSGQWCQEYLFQVQALTASEHLCSKPSEPLLIAWPGLRAPAVHCASLMGASSLQVTWDDPLVTEGVKVKHFRLQCVDRETEKTVESVGPIHPDSRQAEFKHLRRGNLFVFLEIHIYGTNDIVRSDQVQIQLAPAPDPPCIDARVIGLEERRQLQKMTCDLLNTRERLIRMLGNRLTVIQTLPDLHMEKNQAVVQAVHSFSQTEELLDKCLSALTQYTGQLLVHVSWFCQQSNPDMRVTAYRLLIDGKQYGGEIHAEHSSVRVKLKLDQPVHRLTMVALNNDQQATSDESNVLELLTEPFQPFSSYCYHNVHTELARWPNYGCCQYQDSIVYERKRVRKLANQGLLHKQVPMPACYLLDLFEGDYRPILLPHSSQAPHVILFWTSWCLSSKKTMNMLMRFAKENKELNYLAISCDSSSKDRQSLAHLIKQNGWQADRLIHHCSSLCSFPNNLERKKSERNSSKKHCETTALDDKADVSDILGIAGVPTFLFVTDGNISWHGRYCAIDYQTFSAFVSHTISEITDETCSVLNCSLCRQNASGEDISEIIDKIHAYTVQLGIITGRKENSLLDSTFTNAEGDTILIAAPKWDKHGRQSPRILHKRKSSPDSVKLKQLNHEQETPNELSSTLPIQKISRPKTSYRAARIHKQAKNKRTAFISL